MKRLLLNISFGISFLLFLIFSGVTDYLAAAPMEQHMQERWSGDDSTAHVSCFFAVDAGVTPDTIKAYEHALQNTLQESSITAESENPSARLWVDAYSGGGTVSMTTDFGTLEADAVGIGGDFFLFHPLTLRSGAYFSGNDLMQDYCLIDEDAAWQLFGAVDVVGMTVYIGGKPHMITGVVERPKGSFVEAAGVDGTLVYVSYQTLSELGESYGINHYEIIMPNPVTDYAYNHVKENMQADEQKMEIVENSTRFSLLSRLKLIGSFGTRSMSTKAIVYPYWENVARGYEDVIALLTVFMLLFLSYPTAGLLVIIVRKWRHKSWTVLSVCRQLGEIMAQLAEKGRKAGCYVIRQMKEKKRQYSEKRIKKQSAENEEGQTGEKKKRLQLPGKRKRRQSEKMKGESSEKKGRLSDRLKRKRKPAAALQTAEEHINEREEEDEEKWIEESN